MSVSPKNSIRSNPEPPAGAMSQSGSTAWSCPSNIAIIKYWGKRPVQLPMNPSLSITLSKALTNTRLDWVVDRSVKPVEKGPAHLAFFFEKKKAPAFETRIKTYLASLTDHFPWLPYSRLSIHSENTFPHSSGIASSASAMGALALCLCDMDMVLAQKGSPVPRNGQGGDPPAPGDKAFFKRASEIARLGSGSASRSLYGNMVLWGKSDEWKGSSDAFAIPVEDIHPEFNEIHDSILIVESGAKKVSSSLGHSLMDNHPYAAARFNQAHLNLSRLKGILSSGDWQGFIEVLESEALSLHAMMLTSNPGFLLFKPETLSIIEKIRTFREETGLPLGFTLDAGANVHLIYKANASEPVVSFIDTELKEHCENRYYIRDRMGTGPIKLESNET